jgi:hypothetical protein
MVTQTRMGAAAAPWRGPAGVRQEFAVETDNDRRTRLLGGIDAPLDRLQVSALEVPGGVMVFPGVTGQTIDGFPRHGRFLFAF